MVLKALVETGFMLALNPRDRHHEWAMRVLDEARRGEIVLHISPAAPIELSLIMRARGFSDHDVARVLDAMSTIIARYTRPRYPQLGVRELAYAAELRTRYPGLTFFDSIHAAVTITHRLTYYDLDETVRSTIANELEHNKH